MRLNITLWVLQLSIMLNIVFFFWLRHVMEKRREDREKLKYVVGVLAERRGLYKDFLI